MFRFFLDLLSHRLYVGHWIVFCSSCTKHPFEYFFTPALTSLLWGGREALCTVPAFSEEHQKPKRGASRQHQLVAWASLATSMTEPKTNIKKVTFDKTDYFFCFRLVFHAWVSGLWQGSFPQPKIFRTSSLFFGGTYFFVLYIYRRPGCGLVHRVRSSFRFFSPIRLWERHYVHVPTLGMSARNQKGAPLTYYFSQQH